MHLLHKVCRVTLIFVGIVAVSCGDMEPGEPWQAQDDLVIEQVDGEHTSALTNLGTEPNRYLTFQQIQALIKQWAESNPSVLQYGTYGQAHGYDNFYLRASAAVRDNTVKLPKVMINAAIHGDESIAAATLIGVMHRVLTQYGRNQRITRLIDSNDIYFVPVVSPYGYVNRSRTIGSIDPNRSFPTLNGPDPSSTATPAVENLRAWFKREKFNSTLDLHAFGRLVMLPWAYTNQKFEQGQHGPRLRALAKQMADLAGYRWGSIPDLIGNIAPGSSVDWFYLEGQRNNTATATLAMELSTSKRPPESYIRQEVDRAYKPIVVFAEKSAGLFTSTEPVVDPGWPYQPWLFGIIPDGLE